jgi:hypothetical protein
MALVMLFIFSFDLYAVAQKFMQIEVDNEVNALKFYEGAKLTFKTKDYPDDWQTNVIEKILVEDNVILLKDQMINIKDVTEIKLINGTTKAFGALFKTFGAGWFLFGGIAHFTSETNKFTWGQFGIGATAIGIGYLFDKVASKRIYKMGKNANLRLLDISFPASSKD